MRSDVQDAARIVAVLRAVDAPYGHGHVLRLETKCKHMDKHWCCTSCGKHDVLTYVVHTCLILDSSVCS